MYYRIGEKVRIEKGKKSSVWDGMIGTLVHISADAKYHFWFYVINLDKPDTNGKTKVIMVTTNPTVGHRRLTKLGPSSLHPRFINHRKFKFNV